MRTGAVIICFLLSVTSCKKNDRVPADVLPPSKMQAVLWDLMRADKFLTDFVVTKDTGLKRQTESIKMYRQVFAFHAISKEKFQESFSWYKSHPNYLKVIMDSLNTRQGAAPTALARPGDTTIRSPALRDTSTPGKRRINPLRPE